MNEATPWRVLLWPLSLLFGAVVKLRGWLYDRHWLAQKRLPGTVISVGNISTGGTGKTPMVIWLAERFLAQGKRVAILSRGYRGSDGTSDEIEIMKRRLGDRVLFGVGAARHAQGQRIASHGVDIFLLDDGFQHRQLARDIDILMLDGSRTLTNEMLLPAGNLREPISACERADLIVVTRGTQPPDIPAGPAGSFPIFYAQTRLLGFRNLIDDTNVLLKCSELGAGSFFAFCGIGNPQSFLHDLERWHVPVARHRFFRDHHQYSSSDARALLAAARQAGAVAFVTTEKDAENLAASDFAAMPVHIAVIDFVLAAEAEFWAALQRKLSVQHKVDQQGATPAC